MLLIIASYKSVRPTVGQRFHQDNEDVSFELNTAE